jgi:hypothetical protein
MRGRYTVLVERPKALSMLLATDWVTHLTNEIAWEQMRDVVGSDPERAWRLIRAIVGFAPDYGVLCAVAAGPIEDFISCHGESVMPMIAQEAMQNTRFRICLGAAYGDFPADLSARIEAETADVRDLAIDPAATLSGEDLALVVAWLHQSDTAWSWTFLQDMTENDPAAAWDALRALAIFAEEDIRIREEVFESAFEPFIRRHFNAYRELMMELGRTNTAFREWTHDRKQPAAEDAGEWTTFVADLASASLVEDTDEFLASE